MSGIIPSPQVHFIGEIKGATGFEQNRLFCKWSFKTGVHWTLISGNETGETYEEETDDNDPNFFWDHPFDLHYKVNSVRGWP